jgi:hypothetical protein
MVTTDGVTSGALSSTQSHSDAGGADSSTFENAVASETLSALQEVTQPFVPIQRPRSTVYQQADVESECADDCEQGEEDAPASDGTAGKTEYTAKEGDTLGSVASSHGQSVDEILLANPELDPCASLAPGQKIEILDDIRLARWREIARTCDRDKLESLVRQELQYATSNSATPDDLLQTVVEDILKLRPCDSEFADMVGEQAAWSSQLWKAQGRTHEVMDPLQAMAARGDKAGLEKAILDLMRTLAATTPTVAAVEGQRDVLLRFGPQSELFKCAVNDAVQDFLVDRPAQAAEAIADALEENGPLAAAALLRSYTQAGNVDPLSAALILKASRETISSLISYLDTSTTFCDSEGATTVDALERLTIFGHLSAAADSASRSPAAAGTIASMARQINEVGYVLVQLSVEQGNGIVLPLEMIKQSDDASTRMLLTYSVLNGISEFKAQLRHTVDHFAENGLLASEPALLWGALLEEPEAAFEAVLQSTQPDGKTLEQTIAEDIAQIGTQGYQLMRMLVALNDYAPHLQDFPELLGAAELPAPDSDPAIELALGSTPALLEALRATNTHALKDGAALDPYKAILDPGWFQGGRSRGGWNTQQRWDANSTSDAPLGVGLALGNLGTETLGVANKAGGAGWSSGSTDLLYLAQTTLEATQAISALLGLQLDLSGMTAEQISQLPLLQQSLNSGSNYANLLHAVYLSHLETFGIFNIVAAIREIGGSETQHAAPPADETPGETFARQFAPILASYVAANPVAWSATVIGNYSTSSDTQDDFRYNVVRWGSTGVSLLKSHFSDQDNTSYSEPFRATYLEASGVRPEVARALAGENVAPAMQALSNHLNLGPGELLGWFSQQDADWVSEFAGRQLSAWNPSEEDGVPALETLVNVAAMSGHPLPHHNIEVFA